MTICHSLDIWEKPNTDHSQQPDAILSFSVRLTSYAAVAASRTSHMKPSQTYPNAETLTGIIGLGGFDARRPISQSVRLASEVNLTRVLLAREAGLNAAGLLARDSGQRSPEEDAKRNSFCRAWLYQDGAAAGDPVRLYSSRGSETFSADRAVSRQRGFKIPNGWW
ncbi:uncharacterized protein LY79DRAFT_283175 [Colletotrichum navitas]|uniref:Uncharacterized protein n=1 Tax=Colletotrichum navitas TaxID=681940 RepID=A0AAD8VAS1_9PEZI|nr:uncharacterized protein LY79DRAFT_283175 [Colletotrichum navitas]KAK1598191.1 hypothetical protein LY79DRAFT_283175 [Colletotrichum navitas]